MAHKPLILTLPTALDTWVIQSSSKRERRIKNFSTPWVSIHFIKNYFSALGIEGSVFQKVAGDF